MTFIVVAVLGSLAILVAAIAGLLVQRTRRSRTERALRERYERLRLIVEETPAMVWTMRPDSTLDFLNRTCMTFSGLPMEKLLNNGWLDAVHPDDCDRCVGIYVPAVEARRPFLVDIAFATLTAATDGFWRPAFRGTKRTAVFPATSAATSTSPNGRTPKIGFARARLH